MKFTQRCFNGCIAGTGVFLLLSALPVLGISTSASPVIQIRPSSANGDVAIQTALDQLPPTGGTVKLAPGTYEIHRPIFLTRDGLTLRGSGNSTILHLVNGANCPVIIMGTTMRHPARLVHNLCVSDLFIDGNRANQMMEEWVDPLNTSGIENNGLMVQGLSNSVVERVVAAHCRSGGLVTANTTRNLTVSEFTAFDSQFDGLACYQTENSVFTKLDLHDNQCAGISLDLNFQHNLISDSTLSGNDLGIFMRDSRENSFINLSINRSRHDGVFIAQWVRGKLHGWEYIPQTECTDNQFDGLRVQGCAGQAFCVHDPSCKNNIVEDGVFTGNLWGRKK